MISDNSPIAVASKTGLEAMSFDFIPLSHGQRATISRFIRATGGKEIADRSIANRLISTFVLSGARTLGSLTAARKVTPGTLLSSRAIERFLVAATS